MSLDARRGVVYLATGSPTFDFFGGDRRGQNLFGNCVVALDAATGQRRWHFQTVHHDLWDYDLPCPPVLATVTHNGRKIDAVAQVTKTGFVFVLDRDTGQPLFPVEERPVRLRTWRAKPPGPPSRCRSSRRRSRGSGSPRTTSRTAPPRRASSC